MLTPAMLLLAMLLLAPIVQMDTQVIGWTAAACLLGAGLYPTLGMARTKGWFRFESADPQKFQVRLDTCSETRMD
jgi:uncharacterized membrane protein YbjE (DUF340 family)